MVKILQGIDATNRLPSEIQRPQIVQRHGHAVTPFAQALK
jgi:hypothetical protein